MPKRLPMLLLASLLCASNGFSQTSTYRWIDKATGQTVFSDKPPPASAKQVVTVSSSDERAADRQLPYATRQAAERFPVTVYTTAKCADECKAARDLLNGRGIPFSEKTLQTEEDIAELSRRLGSAAGVPSITVGPQSIKGFEPVSWNNLLDLAGYPKSAPYGAKSSGALER